MKVDSKFTFTLFLLEKAQEVYTAACILYDASQWNLVINPLYFACFYPASASLLYRGIPVQSYLGITGKFSEHISRTGEITLDEFRVYAKLLNRRSKGDYNDSSDLTQEDVSGMMEPTKHFIDKVTDLIVLPCNFTT